MESTVSTGPETAVAKKATRKPDLRLRASAASLIHAMFGLFGGALVVSFMVIEGEPLLALPGLLLVAYGLHAVGGVTIHDEILRKRSLFKTVEIHVDDIREIGLGQMLLPPTKYWMPVVDTFDGQSIVLTSAMTLSKTTSADRVRAVRKTLGADRTRMADRFVGTSFKPKKAMVAEATRQLSGYEEYLLSKDADPPSPPMPAPIPDPVEPAPTKPTLDSEPGFTTSWSDDAETTHESTPEVFTPRPLNPRPAPTPRTKPEPQREEPELDLRPASSPAPEPAGSGLASLFGSVPEPASTPAGLTSLFGSTDAAPGPIAEPEPESERLITLFGSVKQENAPLKSLFGSHAQDGSAATGWSDAA